MDRSTKQDRPDGARVAVALSLLGLVAAMVALFAGWSLPPPWSAIAALAAAVAAAACVGATVSIIRHRRIRPVT